MNIKLITFAALTLSSTAPMAATLTIGVDLSASNPLITDATFARTVGAYVGGQIAKLQPGDVLRIRPLGDRTTANALSQQIQINRLNRADKVAARVSQAIGQLPHDHSAGQGSTNIVAFMEFGSFDCEAGGRVIALTDGVESSEYVSGSKFLAGRALPRARKDLLKGCTVSMVGLGQSTTGEISPAQTKHIVTAWSAWFSQAGATFTAVIDL